jgi:hypothetical protein
MVIETGERRPLRDRIAVCDGCGRRLPLRRAGLLEDGAVLCTTCADPDLHLGRDTRSDPDIDSPSVA